MTLSRIIFFDADNTLFHFHPSIDERYLSSRKAPTYSSIGVLSELPGLLKSTGM
uniref:Uncharacterized protein n=1 Tax=Candidatus Kentrum sp. LPFa TaxID=2126335 RepID=A0A450XLE4_9GAMM|nr:MAG: hypothetical protein BECKLPF1236A_GA0070988_101036 [Candidatus Kentron sp. LPFa]VFK30155.1 MAG: hypothetical protein BECKLPF1236C_GA0070990_101046 [Candidatus Kentron sp. LPFa]